MGPSLSWPPPLRLLSAGDRRRQRRPRSCHHRAFPEARELPDASASDEGADLRGWRKERLAGHRHVEGELVLAEPPERDLRGPVSLDQSDQAPRRDVEDAAARSAIADRRVRLHRPLDAGILLIALELADDSRRDAQGASIR